MQKSIDVEDGIYNLQKNRLGSELIPARLTFKFPVSFYIRYGFFRSFTIFRRAMCAAAQKLRLASINLRHSFSETHDQGRDH
jgi:hypothetical protein